MVGENVLRSAIADFQTNELLFSQGNSTTEDSKKGNQVNKPATTVRPKV